MAAVLFSVSLLAAGCSAETQGNSQVASQDEMAVPVEAVEEGMEPVYGRKLRDGVYPVKVYSSSSMFRITECELTVKDGVMGAGEEAASASEEEDETEEASGTGWADERVDHSLELLYADQFSVDYYVDGCAMVTIRRPLQNIYLAATSAMDLFRSLDSVEQVTLSGTDASGWYIREAKQALEDGVDDPG